MRLITTIWFKEILDTIRDRRTLYAMIVAPLVLMPLITILPQRFMISQMEQIEEARIELAVVGAEYGPQLVAYLEETGEVEVIEPPADLERALQEGEILVALTIPADFAAAIAAEEPISLTVSLNESKMTSSQTAGRVQGLLQAYGQQLVAQRMEARGIDPTLLVPIQIERQNAASEEQMGGFFLGMLLPMLIALWAVVGGMYTAIDVTAGEKERGTLEPLLVVPVSRAQIVLGKLLAVISTSLAAVFLSVVSMYFAMRFFPVEMLAEEGASVSFALPLQTVLLIILVALPLVVMLNSLEIAICTFARTFKQAQNYLMPLQFIIMLPAVPLMIVPDLALPFAAYAVPIVGALLSFQDLLTGTVETAAIGLTVGSSLVYAAICLGIAIYVFTRERILFRET